MSWRHSHKLCVIFLRIVLPREGEAAPHLLKAVFFKPFFKKDFIYLFLERGKEGETEKHQCVVASYVPPTGDLAHNPGMCPRLGIKPVTLLAACRLALNTLTTPARAEVCLLSIRYLSFLSWPGGKLSKLLCYKRKVSKKRSGE